MPRLTIDLAKIRDNTRLVTGSSAKFGIDIFGVGKGLCGLPEVARSMLAGGCAGIGDSRLENLKVLRDSGIDAELMLLRLPELSRAEEVVMYSDISLNSELSTLRALSVAAVRAGVSHGVLLMVDLGDLREGVWPDEFTQLVTETASLPGLRVWGVGTNLTCYGGVAPDDRNMNELLRLSRLAEECLGYELQVSAGNSSSINMLLSGQLPRGVTNLRIGEALILGTETLERTLIPGAHSDACVLTAEIIELKEKPSLPIGQLGQDAFGEVPTFVDRGVRRRAIVALGRQDVAIDGIKPRNPGATVLGGSSDHLILDVHDCPELRVGDALDFEVGYGAMLALATSPYVRKQYLNS